MAQSPKTEKLFIAGPVGRLEAVYELPRQDEPAGAVVVCHPHPQHGGTLHNKVAHTLARTFVRDGFAALRFNFRGTEQSEGRFDHGVGELDDAAAALRWMRDRHPQTSMWLAGFSFGAAIAVRLAAVEDIDGLISVAPAVARFGAGLERQPDCPWLILQGDEDELVSVEEIIDWMNTLEPGPELRVFDGAEHFFHGRLTDLRDAVSEFVASTSRKKSRG